MKDIGNPIEEKIEYLNPLFDPEEVNIGATIWDVAKFYEIPNISIDNDTLTIHNLTNLEGGITLNLFQAKVLMLQLQEFISINEENKIIEI